MTATSYLYCTKRSTLHTVLLGRKTWREETTWKSRT